MRTIPIAIAWLVAGLIPSEVSAQSPNTPPMSTLTKSLTRATIVQDNVPVRAGPTAKYPTTGGLKRGDEIMIHHEQDAWLAIMPPLGSVSWVNHRFLSDLGPPKNGRSNAIVLADRVECRLGTDKNSPPLAVKQIDLPRGTLVEVVGEKIVADNTTWYPIVPPEGEYRFIPRDAVAGMGAAPVVTGPLNAANPNASFVSRTNNGASSSNSPMVPPINHPLWLRAEEFERSGQFRQAEDTYSQLARDLQRQGGDHDLILLCYNRINRLRERTPAQNTANPNPPRDYVAPVSTVRQPAPVQQVPSNPPASYLPPPAAPRNASPPPRSNGDGMASASSVAQLQTSGPGYLRSSGFQIDGKPAFVLENPQRGVRMYVTGQQGVALQNYVGQWVELYGTVIYRGDIRGGNTMSVSRVTPLR